MGAGRRQAGAGPPDAAPGAARGYLQVLAAATLWGSSGVFAVALFRRGATPEAVAVLRPVVGLVFLAAAALALRREALTFTRAALAWTVGVGGLATAVFQVAYQMALASTGVPTTVALLYLAPALVVAAAGPLLGEWPTRGRVALAALSVVGVWLTVTGARGAEVSVTPAGVVWGLTAAASYAGYTLFGRMASPRFGAVRTVVGSTAGACVILAIVLPLSGADLSFPADAAAWGILVAFGLLTIAAATFLFYDGLGRIEASRAAITTTAEPVVAAVLATLLLDQGLTPRGWVGLALVVAGVAGAYASRADGGAEAPVGPGT